MVFCVIAMEVSLCKLMQAINTNSRRRHSISALRHLISHSLARRELDRTCDLISGGLGIERQTVTCLHLENSIFLGVQGGLHRHGEK